MLAVVFSKGFGWIDDQFLVIEVAQSWVDGTDFYGWLPAEDGSGSAKGFSLFYTGIHYLLFKLFELIGLTNPQGKMYVVRLIHALWSLLTIHYGYKIALHYSEKPIANRVGWLLALFWIFPFLSVRNLVEYVSVPLLVYGTWLVIRQENRTSLLTFLWAGFLFGLAFNIRFQTLLFTTGIGIVLLYRKKWAETLIMGVGLIAAVVLIQGGIDYFTWGKPFIQLETYVSYNMKHSLEYTTGPWFHYILFLVLALIPPISIFLLFGTFRVFKKMMIIFIPIIIFSVFHSWYPNKQERFISTIIPFIIITGVVGWNMIEDGILNPSFMRKWTKRSWVFFWIINIILLIPISTMYSKKARVESMCYLSKYESLSDFLIEDSNKNVLRFPPQFYLQKWINYEALMQADDFETYKSRNIQKAADHQPGFILFFQPDNLDSRVERMKTVFPELIYETTIEPGLLDKLLHWLNPINDNQNIYIYRNEAVIKEKLN